MSSREPSSSWNKPRSCWRALGPLWVKIKLTINFSTPKLGLSEATDAVRTHAEDLRKKLERALSDADQLVENLASDEKNAIAKERLI